MLFQGLCVDVGDIINCACLTQAQMNLSLLPSFYLLTRFLNVLSSSLRINGRRPTTPTPMPGDP